MQIFDDGRLQPIAALGSLIDLDPSQAFGSVNFDKLCVAVNFAAAHLATAGNAQRHHTATLHEGGGREHFKVHIAHDIGQLCKLQLDAQVWLVRAKEVHGFGIGHDWEISKLDIEDI